MFIIQKSDKQQLPEIASCQLACFPDAFGTKLGKSYVQKSLEWFLDNPHRFLFQCNENGKVIGYCGGFAPAYYGDGSSSGMLQHAFKQAIIGTVKKPWLIFHPELVQYYPHILRNVKMRFLKKKTNYGVLKERIQLKPVVGLVIIGVHPAYRGKGVFELLMQEFEKQALSLNRNEVNLSVKKDNVRAINAYKKFGWSVRKEEGNGLKMYKFL